ncbi:hypothetical protein ESOMN_v1c02590 [Williamsoniiplasma somnilux]|uniref:S1 motif domain-containing protein n=1 Tax=Williamsoniiplasma somnilux TaxID=215578 RepID=A0A2K8P167_9MOLU|nr:S1 RNA-binding domain-containing protein [Williamsoniiplasma somnilux]ATZ18643.1 hypothetical protein ESOMN_v1c02590 [Williamsoniiplasma somnilux]
MINQIVKAKITDIAPFGAFCAVELDGKTYKGLIHISEIANEFIRDINEFIEPGQEVEVKILSIDEAKNQLKLSIKQVNND